MSDLDSSEPKPSPQIEKLLKQLLGDPKSKAFIPLAEEYTKSGMLREAALVLEDGLKVYPSFITALVALGRTYVQLNETEQAREKLLEAIKISPDNILAHRMLARIYADEGNVEGARRSSEMVLFSNPKDEAMLAIKAEIGTQETPAADTSGLSPMFAHMEPTSTDQSPALADTMPAAVLGHPTFDLSSSGPATSVPFDLPGEESVPSITPAGKPFAPEGLEFSLAGATVGSSGGDEVGVAPAAPNKDPRAASVAELEILLERVKQRRTS